MLLFLVRAVSRKQGKLPQWLLLAIAVTLLLQSSFAVLEVGNAVVTILLHILSQTTVRKRRMADIRKGSGGDTCVQSVVFTAAAKIPCGVPRCGEICGKPSFSGKGSFSPALSDLLLRGGATYDYKSNGLLDTAAIGVGPALTGLFFFLLWLKFSGVLQKKTVKKTALPDYSGVECWESFSASEAFPGIGSDRMPCSRY